jgi:CHAD domain-containing protein
MDGSYRLLAARYLRKQTRQLVAHLDGVRAADDIEHVHQARVASRRLRAGLEVFPECFRRKDVKRWRKKMRRLAQGLGAARDRDVQIEFIRGVLAGLKDKRHRAGIARLLVRLGQSRQAIQPEVVKAVDRFEASGVAEEMLAAAGKMRSKLKKRHPSVQSDFVFARAQEYIADRLNELMSFEDCVNDPQDQEHHHAMRIAAKRLRYTLEICQPAYEDRLDRFIRAVKDLQTLLGDLHDCDVWVEHLGAFLEEERERTIAYYGNARPFRALQVGLEHLREERRSRREELFGELVRYWHELDQEALWDELIQAIRPPEERPDALPRADRVPESQDGRKRTAGQAEPAEQPAPAGNPGRSVRVRKQRKRETPRSNNGSGDAGESTGADGRKTADGPLPGSAEPSSDKQ